MAGMALTNVYNHYLTSYAPKGTSRFDTHKKSELRNIYNSIVKMNKEDPLCIVDSSKDTQGYVVSLKENARDLRNRIASLAGSGDHLLSKKAAFSTNEDVLTATYIGSHEQDEEIPEFDIEVKQLASPQQNTGNYLPSQQSSLAPSTYSFELQIGGLNYEFQYNINKEDTNLSVQERLKRLVNNSDVGIVADILEGDNGTTALQFTSVATGSASEDAPIFSISDYRTSKNSGSVDFFGLDQVSQMPTNALFTIAGEDRSTSSNHFTIAKTYEIQLHNLPPESMHVQVGLKKDVESFTENVSTLIQGYNDFIKAASEYTANQPKAERLLSEMSSLTSYYRNDLDAVGLTLREDGQIAIDDSLLEQSALDEDSTELFSSLKNFTGSLVRKTNQITIDPMRYVNKTIVAYKNPDHNYASPYVTSAYSGMMFNSYC